jgi:hypothetical protein
MNPLVTGPLDRQSKIGYSPASLWIVNRTQALRTFGAYHMDQIEVGCFSFSSGERTFRLTPGFNSSQ